MKTPQYCQILEDNKLARQWFKDHNVDLLPWPVNSPDMNIMEHVWKTLEDCVHQHEHQLTSKEELWAILREEWAKLDPEYCQELYDCYL
jgi:hypothetical protein